MRSTLSPAFTSAKMRHMFELVVECAEDMSKYIVAEAKDGKPVHWEMKELFSRYTSDVIASCAFGLKVNSLTDRSNEFFTIGTSSLNFSSVKVALRLLLIRTLPAIMRAIDFELFTAKTKHFFKSMVLDTMDEREKKLIHRPDMVILFFINFFFNFLIFFSNSNLFVLPNKNLILDQYIDASSKWKFKIP